METEAFIQKNIKTVLDIFRDLPADERQKLLSELQDQYPLITVAEFAQLIQRTHRESISFTLSMAMKDKVPEITAVLHTPYADFTAKGSNKAHAKQRAVLMAFNHINNKQ